MANRATVVFDPRLADEQVLVQAIRGAGYDVNLGKREDSASDAATERTAEAEHTLKAAVMIGSGVIAMLWRCRSICT